MIIRSREYKVMLRPERFPTAKLVEGAGQFWSDYADCVRGPGIDPEGSLDEVVKDRTVRFFDTPKRALRHADYVFRVRGKKDTLKFRHPDRFISQARDMRPAGADGSDPKLEEDIKAPFHSLYSHSAKRRRGDEPLPATVDDLCKLYPGLKEQIAPGLAGQPLELVRGFAAHEQVIGGGAGMRLGPGGEVGAECALVVWLEVGRDSPVPSVVEFSFRYGDEGGDYDGRVAECAHRAFAALADDLRDWVDATGPTKTKFAYGEPR